MSQPPRGGTPIQWLLFCMVMSVLGIYGLRELDPEQMRSGLEEAGGWAPLFYLVLYSLGTLLLLPSTPLNLMGGALFGVVWGTVWSSLGAILAAMIAFGFSRTVGREAIARRMAQGWRALDAELQQGGVFYLFAIRLLPIIPYGVVNFAAGLSGIRVRDYLLGTLLGTVPGILPIVMLGSSGRQALETGEVWPVFGALTLTGMLVAGATMYRRRRRRPRDGARR